ncbi:tyrosine phosphatase [Trichoderma arundinaceum]|uniref:protein-tyrosine-phosphatase n=1 Tax=Trichoderma arundinaceum TaxID=490622 RepID=A0A395P1V0_TRIAR|nr:tyrosine phosphatase [Trichoderma arundinaceum]
MALSTIEGVPNLYVGGLWALRRSQSLLDRKITHVLSLVSFNPINLKNFKDEPFSEYGKPFNHLLIDIDDVEDSDLLIELPRAVRFIDEGLRNGRSHKKIPSSNAASVETALGNISLDGDKDAPSKQESSEAMPDGPPQSKLRPGAVFVHCAAGKSRSISAIIAYLLWRYPERFTGSAGSELASTLLTQDGESASEPVRAALALIKKTRPLADPNDGFMAQLDLWWEMGCPADGDIESQPIYQRWLYQRAAKESLAVGQAPSQLFFEDEAAAQTSQRHAGSSSSAASSAGPAADTKLRCKKCRRILATGPFIIPHKPRAFSDDEVEDAEARGLPPPTRPPCQHFFIEPLSWMRGELEKGELGGRLVCPNQKCGAGVGRYDWKGFPCSCGKREDPAFSLQKARVDEEVSRAVLRMPPGGRGGNGNL